MKTERLRVGVIGLGMGRRHAKICMALPDVHLKAICDTSPERLAAVAAELNVKETYQDGYAMIEHAGLDAVIIAVPNHMHAVFSIRALQKGLHVLVEKPIASTIPDAEAMRQASLDAGKILMVGFNQRFDAHHQAAWRYIRQGSLGKIYYATTKWLRRRGVPWWYETGGKGVLSSEIAGGGPLMDLGVHRLDLALFLMGFPEVASVDGTTFRGIGRKEGQKRGIEFALEDMGVALVRFRDNRALLLEASWSMHCKEANKTETKLYGENGGMYLSNEVEVYYECDGAQVNSQLLCEDNAQGGGVTGHFCRVVQKREEPIITVEQAITSLRIIKAIYESATTGKMVYFQ